MPTPRRDDVDPVNNPVFEGLTKLNELHAEKLKKRAHEERTGTAVPIGKKSGKPLTHKAQKAEEKEERDAYEAEHGKKKINYGQRFMQAMRYSRKVARAKREYYYEQEEWEDDDETKKRKYLESIMWRKKIKAQVERFVDDPLKRKRFERPLPPPLPPPTRGGLGGPAPPSEAPPVLREPKSGTRVPGIPDSPTSFRGKGKGTEYDTRPVLSMSMERDVVEKMGESRLLHKPLPACKVCALHH